MGQKTHPLGFRLGITQKHRSLWYTNFHNYPNLLKEDEQIRAYFTKIAKPTSISDILINRNGLCDQIQLNIETGRPGVLVGEDASNIKKIIVDLKRILPKNRQLTISIIEIEKASFNAALVADLVVKQLEERIAFKRAVREALQCSLEENIQGIKIQVSGRLNGAEMARSEWVREGRVPLQTLRADIDYSTRQAQTIYGILGVKVWLFKNEILNSYIDSVITP